MLTGDALELPDVFRYTGVSSPALIMLSPLAHGLGWAAEFVQVTPAHGVDHPELTERNLADDVAAARGREPRFAAELEAARRALPTENRDQMMLRLGLGAMTPAEQWIGLWEAQPEGVDLDGPLPPCVIVTTVVPTDAVGPDQVLRAALRGGGTLTCSVNPTVAAAAAPVLAPGMLLDVTILLARDPSDPTGHARDGDRHPRRADSRQPRARGPSAVA